LSLRPKDPPHTSPIFINISRFDSDMSVQAYSARAAIFVLRYPDLTFPEVVIADAPLVFPYAPGLLVFREGSAMKP
jgi:deoxyinosine 3'endonuclease (endonuclease V)